MNQIDRTRRWHAAKLYELKEHEGGTWERQTALTAFEQNTLGECIACRERLDHGHRYYLHSGGKLVMHRHCAETVAHYNEESVTIQTKGS